MKITRLRILVAALLVAIASTVSFLASVGTMPQVNESNFDRIETGMTVDELNAIFKSQPTKRGLMPDKIDNYNVWEGAWGKVTALSDLKGNRIYGQLYWNETIFDRWLAVIKSKIGL